MICQDNNALEENITLLCGHNYHRICIAKLLIHNNNNNTDSIQCPQCNYKLNKGTLNNDLKHEIDAVFLLEKTIIEAAHKKRIAMSAPNRYVRYDEAGSGNGNIVEDRRTGEGEVVGYRNLPDWLFRLIPDWYHEPARTWSGRGGNLALKK